MHTETTEFNLSEVSLLLDNIILVLQNAPVCFHAL